MAILTEKEKLRIIFESTLAWVNQLPAARNPADTKFRETLRAYIVRSLRSLPTARNRRELARLTRRANRTQNASLYYVQRHLGRGKIP